jgi:hypothetical protein
VVRHTPQPAVSAAFVRQTALDWGARKATLSTSPRTRRVRPYYDSPAAWVGTSFGPLKSANRPPLSVAAAVTDLDSDDDWDNMPLTQRPREAIDSKRPRVAPAPQIAVGPRTSRVTRAQRQLAAARDADPTDSLQDLSLSPTRLFGPSPPNLAGPTVQNNNRPPPQVHPHPCQRPHAHTLASHFHARIQVVNDPKSTNPSAPLPLPVTHDPPLSETPEPPPKRARRTKTHGRTPRTPVLDAAPFWCPLKPTRIRFWCVEANTFWDWYQMLWSNGSRSLERRDRVMAMFVDGSAHGAAAGLLARVKKAGYEAKMSKLVGARRGRAGEAETVVDEKGREGAQAGILCLALYRLESDPSGVVGEEMPPLPSIQFRATTKLCVAFGLFNLCALVGRALSKRERKRIRSKLGPGWTSLSRLADCKQKPWRLDRVKNRRLGGCPPLAWVVAQPSGLFLVEDEHHCVGVDAQRRLVLDCAEKEGRSWALDLTTLTGACQLEPSRATVYQLHLTH